MPSQPEQAALQLGAVQVLSDTTMAPLNNPEDVRKHAEVVEAALKQFPEIRPGHRVAAELFRTLNDYASAEKHYRDEAAAKESSADPLASLALLSMQEYEKRKDVSNARRAVEFASEALNRDPGSDIAWFVLGYAEHALKNKKKAVEALDQVSPYSELSVDALNIAGSIYFDDLKDDHAAYQRYARAAQLAPNNIRVQSNYAEFLLASAHDGQAGIAAARSRDHAEAKAYIKAAMSFVVFTVELLSGDYRKALDELDEIDSHVKVAAAEAKAAEEKGEEHEKWGYNGIRRSLERRQTDSNEQSSALLSVLKFADTNGKNGTLDDMRRWLRSRLAKG
jgi:Tfp pilus assembly protein PilF